MGVRRCPSIGQGAWSGPAVFHTPTLIVLFYTHKHNASFRLPTPKPVMRLQTQESITISLLSKTAFGTRPFGQGKQPRSLTLAAENSVGRPVNSHFDNSLKHLPPPVGFRPVLDRIVTTTETSPEADRGRAQNEGVTLSRTANSRLSWTVVSCDVVAKLIFVSPTQINFLVPDIDGLNGSCENYHTT